MSLVLHGGHGGLVSLLVDMFVIILSLIGLMLFLTSLTGCFPTTNSRMGVAMGFRFK